MENNMNVKKYAISWFVGLGIGLIILLILRFFGVI